MAFSFGNSAGVGSAMGGANVQTGSDLEDIQTEALGFLALSGESKVQLLPTPWPSDQLPPPTASLMSVASHKGLLAAAGPDVVIVATTESVRKSFEGTESGDGNIKPYQPQLKIPMQQRISQLAFTADESYLVLSAENGGGLAVYDVQALLQGSTQTAFEISTNGQSLRALVPNPTAEKGELVALVTADGNLMMANLKERGFISGSNGQILKNGVSCISWSARGKQLVAGLGDGTAYQMTPEGEGKANIPRPPNSGVTDHISSITWLENNVFLVVHTPSTPAGADAPQSLFNIATRPPNSNNFTFQKITEPVGPFGLNRSPPHQFVLRLRDYPPNIQDILIIASSASTDVGMLTRSKVPLTNDKPAEKISSVFTMTEMSDDSRRAQLPMTGELTDTSPIGLVIDLSSKEKVLRPIPGDEIEESPVPLPALMVLNNEGVLAAWWVIYSDSIRSNSIYPGLVAAAGISQPTQAAAQTAFGAQPKPAFGASPFGNSAFGKPAAPAAFGSPSAPSTFGGARPAAAFGAPSLPGASTGAFGAPSALGQTKSLWGSPAATTSQTGGATFGSTAFGAGASVASPSAGFAAPKFGSTSIPSLGMGVRASPWASGGSTAPNAAFGQSGGTVQPTSVFGSSTSGSTAPASGGFASFASKTSAFGAASTGASNTNIFATNTSSSPFVTPSAPTGIFGSQNTGSTPANPPANPFASGGFVLGSTFKADPSAKEDAKDAADEPKSSFFGGGFNSALGEASKAPVAQAPVSTETEMRSDETPKTTITPALESTTPASTPAPLRSQDLSTDVPSTPSLFGSSTPATVKPAPSTGFSFGQLQPEKPKTTGLFGGILNAPSATTTPKSNAGPISPPVQTPPSPTIKKEPVPETPVISNKIPEAPLPPDSTSLTSKELPVSPPSPAPQKNAAKPIPSYMIPPTEVPGGPEDDGGDDSDFLTEDEDEQSRASEEGSGEDLGKDISPNSETNRTIGFTPQSSFAGGLNQSPVIVQQPGRGTLFGELNNPLRAPVLPPPRLQGSPRSPSPVRNALPKNMMQRPDASRSFSAPGIASDILGSQRSRMRAAAPPQMTYQQSMESREAAERRNAELRARQEAEKAQALIDEENEETQRQLAEPIEATTTLDQFIGLTDYIDPMNHGSSKTVPAQVELVYRDINAMIDTLGINARALKCFIKGHTEQYKEEGRNREDLEDGEGWCLVEVENLSALIEGDLTAKLENARVKDVANKLEAVNSLQKDMVRLHAKYEDIRKSVDIKRDPEHAAFARTQPLSAEQAAQQHDLRKDYKNLQMLLAEAEQGLVKLKTQLSSQTNGRSNATARPTVEAVVRTITKMTTMAEKRSGDIDLLENQLRRLRVGSVASNCNESREGTPFQTPQNNRSSMRNSVSNGLFYTPDSIKDSSSRFRHSIMSSVGSPMRESPRHKKLSGYNAEEKTQLRSKVARKQEIKNHLRDAMRKKGVNVRLMGEDD